jgi:hypothetical protein
MLHCLVVKIRHANPPDIGCRRLWAIFETARGTDLAPESCLNFQVVGNTALGARVGGRPDENHPMSARATCHNGSGRVNPWQQGIATMRRNSALDPLQMGDPGLPMQLMIAAERRPRASICDHWRRYR